MPIALGERPYILAENALGVGSALSLTVHLLEPLLPNTVSTR